MLFNSMTLFFLRLSLSLTRHSRSRVFFSSDAYFFSNDADSLLKPAYPNSLFISLLGIFWENFFISLSLFLYIIVRE